MYVQNTSSINEQTTSSWYLLYGLCIQKTSSINEETMSLWHLLNRACIQRTSSINEQIMSSLVSCMYTVNF